MNFGQVLKNLGFGSNGSSPERDSDRPIALGISAGFHAEFLSKCRTGLEEIRTINQSIMSRKLRSGVTELGTAIEQLIDRIQAEPSAISEARPLTGMIKLTAETLDAYAKGFFVDDNSERARRAETLKLVNGLTTDFRELLNGLSRETRIDFSALVKTINRLRVRDLGSQTNSTTFEGIGE